MIDHTNLIEINQESTFNLAKFYIRSQNNFFLFGRRGVGKSEIILQAAQDCQVKVSYINLAVIERSDLCGFPILNDSSEFINFKYPYYLPVSSDNCLILFDEADKAAPEVTAPLLEILQFKTINGKKLNISNCILTGNLSNEGAYSNLLSSALLDRGAKYILKFDFEQWLEWARSNNVHDLIIGFLKYNPDLACGKIENTSYASPSPRGWTLASEAIIKAQALKIVDLETITQIVSGFVGAEAGLKFKVWYEHYRKFDPFISSLIDSGSLVLDFKSLTSTEKVVFVISACHRAKQRVLEPSKSRNRFAYLEHLCDFLKKYPVDPELQVIGLNSSFSFEFITQQKLYKCKQFFDLFSKISENFYVRK